MNIHKSQLFWGSLGTRVLTHPQMSFFDALGPGSQRQDLELMASTMEAGRFSELVSTTKKPAFWGQIASGNDGFNMVLIWF